MWIYKHWATEVVLIMAVVGFMAAIKVIGALAVPMAGGRR